MLIVRGQTRSALFFLLMIAHGLGQPNVDFEIPADATDDFLMKSAQRLLPRSSNDSELEPSIAGGGVPLMLEAVRFRKAMAYADALLERFPDSVHRDRALMIKLAALGRLSWTQPHYLAELRTLTETISQSNPKGRLAAENAFYSIQAFVLGARFEDMPEQQRLLGSLERYQAFVEDHRQSGRRPMIWTSLIRAAIALNKPELALQEFQKLRQAYPEHQATQRALGEVNQLTALGKPFALAYATENGDRVRTVDLRGKVLLVHFWATWNQRSMDEISRLRELHDHFASQGLHLIGINADTDRRRLEEALATLSLPWPQYYDLKGLQNDILVGLGVVKLPTQYLVDRKGLLRAINPPPDRLPQLIEALLRENG